MSATVRLNASHAGYWEIGPIFRIINIISDDADIWDYIENGDLREVQRLFKKRRASARDCASDGDTLLHYAARHYQREICRFLLAEGADAVAINSQGESPLDVAHSLLLRAALNAIAHRKEPTVIAALFDTCRLLETYQYQVSDSMKDTINPYALYSWKENQMGDSCIDILRADPCGNSIMTEWLRFFRQRYPDIDAEKNSLDVLQAMIAAMSPNFYSIGFLYLAYGTGSDINVLYSVGSSLAWTAVHIVLQCGDKMDPFLLKTKLRLLIHNGADIEIAASCGCSTYDLAREKGTLMPLLEVMEEFGLSPSEKAITDGYSECDEQRRTRELKGDDGVSTTIVYRDSPEAGVRLRNRRPHTHHT